MKRSSPPDIDLQPGEGIDPFMDGRLNLIQSKNGYRFSIDAVFLAEFVSIKPADVVVDLGAGCGVIPLILLLTRPVGRVYALEIQEELAHQAMRNAVINGYEDRMAVILGDIKSLPVSKGCAEVVICNPPYRKVNSGRINPDLRKAIARHELAASADDILNAAGHILAKKGRLAMIYPAERLVDILARMRRFGLEPKRVRINYPDPRSNAKLVLIEACLGGRPGLKILPPLLGQGNYTI